MSDIEKTGEGVVTEKLKIIVDRSKVEEDLQKQLDDERKARDKVNADLEEATKKLNTMEEAIPDKEEEFKKEKDELQKQIDDGKKQLADIAMEEFNKRKGAYIDKFKEIGIPEEKVTEMDAALKGPADLDNAEMYLTMYSEMLQKSQEERDNLAKAGNLSAEEQAAKDKAALEAAGQQQGGGVVPLKPADTKSGKDMVYDSYREGIDDLYKRQETDPKAKRALSELWDKAGPTMKSTMKSMAIAQCPRCDGGILEGELCPYCGFDPATYVQRGNLFSR